MDVFVLTAHDRTGTADETVEVYGVYSCRERATDAIMYWMFENMERAESYEDKDYIEEYVTDQKIWRIEKVEVDFVI